MTQPQDALVPTTQSAVAVTVTVAKPIGMTPKSNVLLDGTRMVNTVGRNVYPVAPGQHMLSCEVNVGGSTFGQADIAVEVLPAQTTEVYYSAPMDARKPGRIGLTPQAPYSTKAIRAFTGVTIRAARGSSTSSCPAVGWPGRAT